MTDEITSIRVRKETRDRIASYGSFGDSMEDIILRLLQAYEELEKSKDY